MNTAYKYRIIAVPYINNQKRYVLQDIYSFLECEDLFSTTEMKNLLEQDCITNAVWRGKVEGVTDIEEALQGLERALEGCPVVGVNCIKRLTAKRVKFSHMFFLNHNGRDITPEIWCVLERCKDYKFTVQGRISVKSSPYGGDAASLLWKINEEAKRLGWNPIVKTDYVDMQS